MVLRLGAESLNLSLTSAVLQGNICSSVLCLSTECDFLPDEVCFIAISVTPAYPHAHSCLHLNELHVTLHR